MNETLISNYNSCVKSEDICYFLGDFCFGSDRDFNSYFHRLNGKIILIKGNHDKVTWKNKYKFHESYESYKEVVINSQNITLCHYALRTWNRSHRSAWCLCGHSHGSLKESLPDSIDGGLLLDVGVDVHNYSPVSFEEVARIMSKKTQKMKENPYQPDHHVFEQ